ncbi:hypothetical protein LTR53_002306 [Teratosphaeriaceae sp. CCFEE 6253]|nr:hypothetical protein LTR53_002306 [Teratosphaeriaceae sp. CCFEE 6253]
MKDAGPLLIITSPECHRKAVGAARSCGLEAERVLILNSHNGSRDLVNVMSDESRNLIQDDNESDQMLHWETVTDHETLTERPICLVYSSGTTGTPKGVKISNANLVYAALAARHMLHDFKARRRSADPLFSFEFRTLAHLPNAHIAGLQGYFVNTAACGGTTFWMPKFHFDDFLAYNRRLRITYFFSVPAIYLLIVKSPLVTDQFASLVHAVSGAAPLGAELAVQVQSKLGCRISQTWGLSETTGSVTLLPWDRVVDNSSVSLLMPNTSLRIVGDDKTDAVGDTAGELLVKGPQVVRGYWKSPKATADSFTRDGLWLKTGDIGQMKNGLLYLVDRKKVRAHKSFEYAKVQLIVDSKEMIKYKGLQIAPAELEAVLQSHPLIRDAAVIGVRDTNAPGNELPRAYIVANAAEISPTDVKDFVKDQLASHKQRRGGVEFVDSIPKSASGKILRRQLRSRLDHRTGRTKL